MDERFEAYERQGITIAKANEHARRLAAQAAEQLARDPATQLVALLFTPDTRAIRESVPGLIRSGQLQPGDWVPLLVSRERAVALLRSDAPQIQEQLEPVVTGRVQRLPVVLVTPFGMKFGFEEFEVAGRSSQPLPAAMTVHAMLICREVFQQEGSGKWCAIGIHSGVRVTSLPCRHAFAVLLSLGDFASGARVQLVVRRGADELARGEVEATINRPFGSIDLGVSFPALVFPETGTWNVDLIAGGRVLATRELTVVEDRAP